MKRTIRAVAVSGLAWITAGGAALMTGEKKAQAGEAKPKTGLYRETEHIRRYYELAR